jgi:hypothetical protein
VVDKGSNNEFVVYGGVKQKKYDFIEGNTVTGINDKLTYRADGAIVYGEEELGQEYAQVSNPIAVNGKLAYVADDGEREFVIYDGKEQKKY